MQLESFKNASTSSNMQVSGDLLGIQLGLVRLQYFFKMQVESIKFIFYLTFPSNIPEFCPCGVALCTGNHYLGTSLSLETVYYTYP